MKISNKELWESISDMNPGAFADVWISDAGHIHFGIPQIKFQRRRSGKYKRRYFRVNGDVLINVDVHTNCIISLSQVVILLGRHYAVDAVVEFVNEETYVRNAR